jgi:hypothetical protein
MYIMVGRWVKTFVGKWQLQIRFSAEAGSGSRPELHDGDDGDDCLCYDCILA